MDNRWIAGAALVALVLIVGAIMFVGLSKDQGETPNVENVRIVDGRQIVEIAVKGGYEPKRSVAMAGIPTTVRFTTEGTFDCSSAVVIPSLKIAKNLPQTGVTDIDIGVQPVGALSGTCSMGMYRFEIDFREATETMTRASNQ